MSLRLVRPGTEPSGLVVKTFGVGNPEIVYLGGEYKIAMDDFLSAALYVLTNSDLVPDDPRLTFVEYVSSMKKVPGWNSVGRRLEVQEPEATTSAP